jgi:hypothetical protein
MLRRFPICSSLDFRVFSELFSSVFRAHLVPSILRCRSQICWWESWIVASCIFVLDLDPPNSEFGLRLKDFGWKLSFVLELGRISIPIDSLGLRLQICRHNIS